MKKAVLYLIILLGLVFFLNNIHAQEEEPEPLALDGTEWAVQMSYTDTKGQPKTSSDKLIFEDGKFNSENQKEDGFKDSNYTLSAKGDATVFETMQSSEGKDKAFWRGEVRTNNVRGILSVHHYKGDNKEIKDYTFGGALAGGAIKETEKSRKERLAAQKEAEDAKARAAREAAREASRKAAEEAAAKAAAKASAQPKQETVAESAATGTAAAEQEQGVVDKFQAWWDKVTGKTQ